MRIRTIKPEFWRSPDVMALSLFERLLWIGLWSLADDEGRGVADPKAIAADLFLTEYSLNPHGVLTDASSGLEKLADRGMIALYRCDGRLYFNITNWKVHQKVNRPAKSRLPALTDPQSESVSPHGAFTESSLNPHYRNREQGTGNREQEKQYCSPGADTSPIPGLETPHEPADAGGALACAEHNPPTPKPKPEPYPDAFEEFWAAYPRKVGKRKALPAWQKAVRRAGPETVLAGAKRLANDPNLPEAQFIPHPATWLNRDSWDDPPLPNPHARSGQQKRVFGTRPEDWLSGGDGGGVVEGEVVTADESTTWANTGHDQVFQDYLAQIGGRS